MATTLDTAQELALAVLKGDATAIGPLLDCLSEQYAQGNVYLRPLGQQVHAIDASRLRAIFYTRQELLDADVDIAFLRHEYERWLQGVGGPLLLAGIDRVEFYELPEQVWGHTINPEPSAIDRQPLVADRLATYTTEELINELNHRGIR